MMAGAFGAGSASAADLEADKNIIYAPPPQYQPIIVAAPFTIWTGCFAGANAGGVWARWGLTESTPVALSGSLNTLTIAGGGQLGCDFQWDRWVFGVQGMLDGSNIRATTTTQLESAPGTPFAAPFLEQWMATATGRVGYTILPPLLLYVRGGPAFAQGESVGWTVGGGLDWKFLPDWSIFLEYGYLEYGAKNLTFAAAPGSIVASYNLNIQTVLLGLNYRFNIGPPVTTQY